MIWFAATDPVISGPITSPFRTIFPSVESRGGIAASRGTDPKHTLDHQVVRHLRRMVLPRVQPRTSTGTEQLSADGRERLLLRDRDFGFGVLLGLRIEPDLLDCTPFH